MSTRRPPALSKEEVGQQLPSLPGWSLDESTTPPALCRTAELASFRAAIDAVVAVADLAERLDHHPDMHVSWRTVTFRCWTHVSGGVTELDLTLARGIDGVLGPTG